MAVLCPAAADAASVVLRSRGVDGDRAGLYGNVVVFAADAAGHPTGPSIFGCPAPEFSGSSRVYTTCSVDREQLARSLGGPPEGRILVAVTPKTNGRTNCGVEFATWSGRCTGEGVRIPKDGPVVQSYECPFDVPLGFDLPSAVDVEVTANYREQPGTTFNEQCFLVGIDQPGGGGGGGGGGVGGGGGAGEPPALARFLDNLTLAVLQQLDPALRAALIGATAAEIRKLNIAAANAPRGTVNATVTATPQAQVVTNGVRAAGGVPVIMKGKRKVKREGSITFVMKATRAGRRFIKQGTPFQAAVDVRFRGPIGEATRSFTLRVD